MKKLLELHRREAFRQDFQKEYLAAFGRYLRKIIPYGNPSENIYYYNILLLKKAESCAESCGVFCAESCCTFFVSLSLL